MENAARICGLFHDFGKRSQLFQDVLQGKATGVDHAGPGAALLAHNMPKPIVEAIAGHHAGLISEEMLRPYLQSICRGDAQAVSRFDKTPSLSGTVQMADAMNDFMKEHQGFIPPHPEKQTVSGVSWKNKMLRMLQTRMLFSCQVDADWSVSSFEATGDDTGLLNHSIQDLPSEDMLDRLENHRKQISVESQATENIIALRDMVYRDCGIAGRDMEHSFWTLTAPTGSGKTLGMLRFALERVLADKQKQRIILVLPFLSLVDQTAAITKRIIPGTVVDTSQSGAKEDERLRSEKWNAPCIVTTTVQFFDSLFSDQPGDCRKLHNMANSIIIFDEIQALPHSVARLAMQSLYWLSNIYHSCIVLSTATQPQYQMLPELDWDVREMIQDVPKAFRSAVQKRFEFLPVETDLKDIAAEAGEYDSVCVVCNLKRHALEVYREWKKRGLKNIYLLSTDLCPAHRAAVIDEIKACQKAGSPVRVAATQCIEAGVDLDFKRMYRALGPLTSLIQAAGRQNRNGRFEAEPMVVFQPKQQENERWMYPGPDYEGQAMIVKTMHQSGHMMTALSSIKEYYRRLFGQYREPAGLWDSMMGIEYDRFAKEAQLIKNTGYQVVVPYAAKKDVYATVLQAVRGGNVAKRHLAMATGITVQVYDRDGVLAHCQEISILHHGEAHPTGTYILLEGHESCYDNRMGLCLDGEAANSQYML